MSERGSVWPLVEIGDVAEVVGGGTPSTRNVGNFDGDVPWLTPKDLSGSPARVVARGSRNLSRAGLANSSARLVPPGTVLLSTRAPIGYAAIAGGEISTNQGFRNLLPRGAVRSDFLYYWLKANTEALERHAVGTTFRELPGSVLKRIRIPLPPLSEQRAVARVLGALDDKIEANRRMSATLEGLAQAVFKDWFVDFGPVRAKAAGRARYLPDPLWSLFPDRLVESELGEIPEGWEVGCLGDLSCKPQYGYTASARADPAGPKFLRITDINKSNWINWGVVPYCDIDRDDIKKYALVKGDILIARMADPGHGVLIEENRNAVFASYLIRFRPLQQYYGRYLQYWLRSPSYWSLVKARAVGTTRVSLNAKVLGDFPIVVPSSEVLEAFSELIEDLRSRVVTNSSEEQTLGAMRDTLLPKLVSGELRVRGIE